MLIWLFRLPTPNRAKTAPYYHASAVGNNHRLQRALAVLSTQMIALTASIAATHRPIIGILALPLDHTDCVTFSSVSTTGATSCFHSLYVKWLEAAGARVAPLPFDLPASDFDKLLGSLNGALITGGETAIKEIGSPYMEATKKLYDHSLALHRAGEVWPLWGTCMGMQVLSILGARDPSVLLSNAYDSEGLILPLELTSAAASSRLLCEGCLPAAALATLRTRNVTVNLHHDGVAPSSFAAGTTLGGAFRVLSTNVDAKGKAFASTIEATGGAPIWGAQWHPERPQFEWKPAATDPFNHGAEAISAMFSVAARLVAEARKSTQSFGDEADEAKALIYNFAPVGTADGGSYQAYLFGAGGAGASDGGALAVRDCER